MYKVLFYFLVAIMTFAIANPVAAQSALKSMSTSKPKTMKSPFNGGKKFNANKYKAAMSSKATPKMKPHGMKSGVGNRNLKGGLLKG
jgi:hypothetical protein